MSVSEPGPRTPDRLTRPRSRRGRWVLLGVVVAFVALTALIVTNSRQPKTGPGGAGGPPGMGGPPGGGGHGGGGGVGGRRGGGFGGMSPVGAAQAQRGDVPVYLSALGTVTPVATVTVRTQIAGQLFSVAFQEGQFVSKGQLLAQVDPRPYEQALAQARGALARDTAQLENARLDLQRYQTLLAQDSIARQQVDTQRATVRQLEGALALDRAQVGAAQVNLNYTRVTAPISGKVGLRQVDAGNYVTTGDANGLVTITQVDPIDVVFTIPEDQVSRVNSRMRGARLEVTAFDRGQKEALATGALFTLDNQIDTTTGTVKAKARFQNGGSRLYPNQFVNIRVLVDTLSGVVTAPTSAVLRGQQGLFVYVVDAQRSVHIRNVQTGPAAGELTAITSGLSPGETVVTDGSDRLREGARVLLPGDCPPVMPAGGPGAPAAKKLSWWDKLLGKKPPVVEQPRRGFDANGNRCRPLPMGGSGRGQMDLSSLNLDAAQKAKVDSIQTASRAQFQGLMASGDFAGMRSAREAANKQIEAVLRPDQVARFRQLQEQQRAQRAAMGGFGGSMGGGAYGGLPAPASATTPQGAPAAPPASAASGASSPGQGGGRPPGAPAGAPGGRAGGFGGGPNGGGRGGALFAELGLDAGQQAKVDAIRAEYGPKMREAFQSGDMAAAGAVRQQMSARIEAILRPDQRARYQAARERMRQQGGGFGGGRPGGGPPGGF